MSFSKIHKKEFALIMPMVTLDQLRVCKSCGNVFSKKAGASNITECPQCKATSFEPIVTETTDDEEVYLDELD